MGILNDLETTEVIYGAENIVKRTLESYSSYHNKLDGCFDHTGPAAIVTTEPVFKALNGLIKRGVRLRYITDITASNISYCKEMIKNGHKLRHIEGVKGNFGIADEAEYVTHGIQPEGEPVSQVTATNVKSFVESQQYFFDTLWNKAIPAE